MNLIYDLQGKRAAHPKYRGAPFLCPNISKVVIVVDHKCWHHNAIDPTCNENCPNCSHWGWTRCKDETLLRERFEETYRFRALDFMMRDNKGVRVD